MQNYHLWADSFHEGDWACQNLGLIAVSKGWEHSVQVTNGFIPIHTYSNGVTAFSVQVFGDYRCWDRIPEPIDDLLAWGKPDFLAYSPSTSRILFAVEETAAVPTGNQALQRCERMYGAARSQIPFWYLLSEYGVHLDGAIRRDSIWPSIMAIKLTRMFSTPSVVLRYSTSSDPENYASGDGVESLFSSLFGILRTDQGDEDLKHELEIQYASMLTFIESQWSRILSYVPGAEVAFTAEYAAALSELAVDEGSIDRSNALNKAFTWPTTSELPRSESARQRASTLIKHDRLLAAVEGLVDSGKAWTLSTNAGSRPQPEASVKTWIRDQERDLARMPTVTPPATWEADISDFPLSQSGMRHVTTSKNIIYLLDDVQDLSAAVGATYPRLADRFPRTDDTPCFLYVSNSLRPGRIFGDPFTGQLSAFSVIFRHTRDRSRLVFAYYPHQTHAQSQRQFKSKGMRIASELVDWMLFGDGVLVSGNGEVVL